MRRFLVFLAVALASFLVLRMQPPSGSDRLDGPADASAPSVTTGDATPAPPQASRTTSGKGFRSSAQLTDHYAKHGAEFPGLSEAQYLAMAQMLRDAQVGGEVLEVVRASDGVISRFDKRTGAFIAFDRDGTIRTFFKPNDGERYFRRQANRAPSQ